MTFFAEEQPRLYTDPVELEDNPDWFGFSCLTFGVLFLVLVLGLTWRPLRNDEQYWMRKFLESLERRGTVSGAARDAGVTIAHAHQIRDKNPFFRKRWQESADRFITLAMKELHQ